MINPDAIPELLRNNRHWVCWCAVQRGGKLTKIPKDPRNGSNASTTDPQTWAAFDEAWKRFQGGRYDGIGYVFAGDYIGVDLDHAIDESTRTLKPWAAEIVKACATYAEISPSGAGVHLISKGTLPKGWHGRKRTHHDGAVEIYSVGRYFTVTGDHIPGTSATIEDQSARILKLYSQLGGNRSNGAGRGKLRSVPSTVFSDDQRLEAALRDPVFCRLWYGDISYNKSDDSAADLALCNKLAFYFGRDPDTVDRMFRQSKLYRPKWDREDYRDWTITKALEGTPETYAPRNASRAAQKLVTDPEIQSELENDAPAEEALRPAEYSDDALADLFSTEHEQDFLYVDSWGWLKWTGQRWRNVPDVVVMGCARQICRLQAELCRNDAKIQQRTRAGLARALASAKTVAAVVRLAASDPRHYTEVQQFDADLWLFNTPGGTIDLRTGELRPHRREDRITKQAQATPHGECPKWRAFLDYVTDHDKEVQAYLQRLAGYALCGDPSEECLDFFYGEGGNGKGTFLKTLQYVFGDYSTTAQSETFLEAKGERHPTDIAKLAGARLVVAQEIDEGQHWNEVRLKTLTGRDEMTARFMRRDLFDFTPQFTLIISGNNKPALKTVDEAWRRRFHLVPFNVSIPKTQQNPDLKTELRAEADGILAWCVEGCLAWQKLRLDPPKAVLTATEEYLDSEDTFEMWLDECCLRGHEGYEEPTAWLYLSHRRWKEARGERPPGTKTFSQRVEKHGFHRRRDSATRHFTGLRLTDTERVAVKDILEARKRREQAAETREEDYLA